MVDSPADSLARQDAHLARGTPPSPIHTLVVHFDLRFGQPAYRALGSVFDCATGRFGRRELIRGIQLALHRTMLPSKDCFTRCH